MPDPCPPACVARSRSASPLALRPGRTALRPLAVMVLVAAAVGLSAPAARGQGSVTVTRTYTYDSTYFHLTRVVETPSDGPARTTEYRYAHEQYSAMRAKNMLSQPYRVTVCRGTCEEAGADVEARTWTTWKDWGSGRWRPWEAWAWQGAWLADGHYNDDTAPERPVDQPAEVTRTSVAVSYDGFGRATEINDARGTPTAVVYGRGHGAPDAVVVGAGAAAVLADGFGPGSLTSGGPLAWHLSSASWRVRPGGGALEHAAVATGVAAPTRTLPAGDFTAEFGMRVVQGEGASDWVAFQFQKAAASHDLFASGYAVYLRGDGGLDLYSQGDGVLGTHQLPGGPAWRRFRVEREGAAIRVYADGALVIQAQSTRHTGGYVGFQTYRSRGEFAGLRVYPRVALATSYERDAAGRVTASVDEAGSATAYAYDGFGRLTGVRAPETALAGAELWTTTHAYAYGSAGTPNHVTTRAYATQGGAHALTRAFTDGLGRPVQTQTQTGSSYLVSATEHDAQGRPWRQWQPYTRATNGVYDASFDPNAKAYYDGSPGPVSNDRPFTETLYTADPTGRVREGVAPGRTSPTSVRTAYGVEAVDGVHRAFAETTNEVGWRARTYTDAFGNTVGTVAGYGTTIAATTRFEHDVAGRAVRVVQPGGQATRYVYDGAGRLTRRESPDAGHSRFKHDRAGNVRFAQDANQAAGNRALFTQYDFAGRPTRVGERALGSTTFASLSPTTTYSWESTTSNWLVVSAYDRRPAPDVFPWSLFAAQVDALTLTNTAGRLAARASKSDGAWQAELYSYDGDGRVAAKHVYTHDGTSVLTALNAAHRYTYDLQGRMLTRHSTVGTKHYYHWYGYDDAGRLLTVHSGTSSTKPTTADVRYAYNGAGALGSQRHAAMTALPYMYDVRGWLVGMGSTGSTTYPFSAAYTFNAAGFVTTTDYYNKGVPATYKRHRFTHTPDEMGRLTRSLYADHTGSAWSSSSAYELWGPQYDGNGNLRTLNRNRHDGTALDRLTYTYAAGTNRLASVTDAIANSAETWDAESTGAIPYDANGNMTTVPVPYSAAAVYDWRNLPVTLTRSGVTTRYRYAASGQRTWKRTGSGAYEYYALDGAATAGVFRGDGGWDWNVLSPGGEVLGREPYNNDKRYYVKDHLGTVRSVVTASGTIVEARDYDAWGVALAGRAFVSGAAAKEGYTGHERDAETGLDYAGARYYLSAYGRWNGVDPLAGLFPGHSPYNYVLNNPMALVDPDGRAAVQAGCPPCDFRGTIHQTFGFAKPKFDQAAYSLGIPQVQTSPPAVYKGWAAGRELFMYGAYGLGGAAIVFSGVGLAGGGAAAGKAALGVSIRLGTLSSRASAVQVLSGTIDLISGGETQTEEVVAGALGIGTAGATSYLVRRQVASASANVLVRTGLDQSLDDSIEASGRLVHSFAESAGFSTGFAAGSAASVFFMNLTKDRQRDQDHQTPENR